jgi:hypothetical protein
MAKYLSTPWKSKPLLLAIYYLLLAAVFLASILMYGRFFYFFALFVLLQLVPAFFYAASRYRKQTGQVFLLAILYFCFGWARAVSIFDMVLRKEVYQNK